MSNSPVIQYENAETGEPCFDSEQRPVPSVEPDIYFDEAPPADTGLDLEPFLDFLLRGSKTSQAIGDRVLCLAYLMPGVSLRPRTLSDLALWLGVKSSTTAKSKLEALLPIFKRELRILLDRPRINEG